jgi:N-acetylneuraminic acid mutarotase
MDGTVLLTGGYNNRTRELLDSAELYNPQTGEFSATGVMNTPRVGHTATLLADGRVLIAGGGTFSEVWQTAEIYDPETGEFTLIESLLSPRYKHAATRLNNGDVLIIGGSDHNDWDGQYTSVELYDPENNRFYAAGELEGERFKLREAVALLPSGEVLVAGGNAIVELYNPDEDQFYRVEGMLDAARFFTSAVTLLDGRVLITGGYDRNITSTGATWLYIPGQ